MSGVVIGRFPIPADARLVLVFGGTFDPPHTAHVELPALARTAVGADLVLYVPAARSPHKADGPHAPGDDRTEMLRLALEGQSGCAISTLELNRAGQDQEPSFTIDTLRTIRSRTPASVALRLLIGADQAAAFHRWRQPREIVGIAEPLVMLRTPHETADALLGGMAAHWSAMDLEAWRERIVEIPVRDVEATEVRRMLAANPDDPALTRLIPAPVLAYIRAKRLYA